MTLVFVPNMHFPLCNLPLLHPAFFFVSPCSSLDFVQPDLAHLAAEPIAMVLLKAYDKALCSEWSADIRIPPLPALRELLVAAIFGVKMRLLASIILGIEVPFHRVTTRSIICGLDTVACDPNRSTLDSDVDFKSFTIALEVTFAVLEKHLRSVLPIVE